jgi:hypothetical protein
MEFGGPRFGDGAARRALREVHAHAERQSIAERDGQGSPDGRIAATLHIT